jgi:hypothetical protein
MGLAPQIFWSMSLVEWCAAVKGYASRHGRRSAPPLSRGEFESLMQAHPDRAGAN